MTNVQTHRGPDDSGLWERHFPDGGYIGLGSRRLANLRPMVDDLLSERQVRKRGLFRPEVVRRYVNEQRRGAEDWSMQIWQLLTLEIWMHFFSTAARGRSLGGRLAYSN